MSSDSLAAFRKTAGKDLAKLAEEHLQHDLREEDRTALKSAASKLSTHTFVGSLIGLSLGAILAFRLRQSRARMFQTFRAAEKPTHIRFASGREEALPDLTPVLKPSPLGDFAAYTFFAAGGLLVGGETGLLTGSWAAKRTVNADPAGRQRIENAFRRFRIDVLQREIDQMEKGEGEIPL